MKKIFSYMVQLFLTGLLSLMLLLNSFASTVEGRISKTDLLPSFLQYVNGIDFSVPQVQGLLEQVDPMKAKQFSHFVKAHPETEKINFLKTPLTFSNGGVELVLNNEKYFFLMTGPESITVSKGENKVVLDTRMPFDKMYDSILEHLLNKKLSFFSFFISESYAKESTYIEITNMIVGLLVVVIVVLITLLMNGAFDPYLNKKKLDNALEDSKKACDKIVHLSPDEVNLEKLQDQYKHFNTEFLKFCSDQKSFCSSKSVPCLKEVKKLCDVEIPRIKKCMRDAIDKLDRTKIQNISRKNIKRPDDEKRKEKGSSPAGKMSIGQ